MTDLIKINPQDYGLTETKAQEISNMFKPMLDKMTELEAEYNKIVNMEINPLTCQKAKELRLKYVKVRTGTAAIHKELKAFYLQGGRFVDGWKNAQLMASQGNEEKLNEIEKYYEIQEKNRIKKLQDERIIILHKYEPEMNVPNLGEMDNEIWENYINGVKLNYEQRIEAEKLTEAERIRNIEAEKAEKERIRKENEKLLAEQKRQAEILRKERQEKERIEKELQDKLLAEQKAEQERIENLEKEASKNDAEKYTGMLETILNIFNNYKYKSKTYKNRASKLEEVINKELKEL